MPHTAIVALGSNIGDRAGYLRLAVEGLGQVTAMSRVYETDPVGGPKDQGAFLNMVVAIDTALDPFTLLRQCQQLKATATRQRRVLGAKALTGEATTLIRPDGSVVPLNLAERLPLSQLDTGDSSVSIG